MPATTETILGVFAHVDTTVRALEELKAKGYHDLTVYTPVPVHEIEDVVERDRPVSKVRLFTLLGALTGLASGWIITAWTSLQWGLIVGGKPPIGFPSEAGEIEGGHRGRDHRFSQIIEVRSRS